MKNKKTVILIAFLALAAAVLVVRQILFKPGEKLQILESQPFPGQTQVKENQITLEFNQNIEELEINIYPNPDFEFTQQKEENSLIINSKNELKGETEYNLEVVAPAKNFRFNLSFTTNIKNKETQVEERGDPEAEEKIIKQIVENYPLYYQTPKKGENWLANYTDKMTLIVEYTSAANIANVKDEVFAWMEENQIDPDSHKFVWRQTDEIKEEL